MEARFRKNGRRGDPRVRAVKHGPRPVRRQRWVWWCWGLNAKGRMVALGSFETQAEAQEVALTRYPSGAGVYQLNTISLVHAKECLKAIDIKEGKMIDVAMRRASSKLP